MTFNIEKNRRILVVDDNLAIHNDFRKILGKNEEQGNALHENAALLFDENTKRAYQAPEFEIDSAYQGQESLQRVVEALADQRPYALAFVDVRMPPGWDGVETLEYLWDVDPNLQVVLCTAYSDHSVDAILDRIGETDRLLILKKPIDNESVRLIAVSQTEKWRLARVAAARQHELEQAIALRTHEIINVRDTAVFALAKLAESRDTETGEHLERLRTYSQILAEQLSKEGPYTHLIDDQFLEDMYRSSPLHDIGKVGIQDAILLKPGRLTPEEFEIMKTHAEIGARTLDEAITKTKGGGFLTMAAEIARYHHERFDGTGYPQGLAGLEIPLAARIVALSDVFDALSSARVYKPAFAPEEVRRTIESESGKHFDPAIVNAFRARYDDFLQVMQSSRQKASVADQSSLAAREMSLS